MTSVTTEKDSVSPFPATTSPPLAPSTTSDSSAAVLSMTSLRPHKEQHTEHGLLIRDFIIGFSDGLTVPFALTAGLSSLGSSRLVILGGLAELFSGAISMGLGAYLAAVTDLKHYEVEEARERREVRECPAEEEDEIYQIFEEYGIERGESRGVIQALKGNEEMWIKFMMDFELKLLKPNSRAAIFEGLVMGLAYFVGGILPMIPYFAVHNVDHALFGSIAITVIILICFGYAKAITTGTTRRDAVVSALHTLLVGVAAAGTSYGIVRGVNAAHPH